MLSFAALLVFLFALPALVAAWAWRGLALRLGWVDQPDGRRLHVEPTPRGGGIGIVLSVAMAITALLGTEGPRGLILAGLALTAGAGLIDDVRPLTPLPKLLMQIAGTLPLALALPAGADVVGPVAAVLISWAVALVLVNVWNFMDGSNGLVASQGLIVGVAAAALAVMMSSPGRPDGLSDQPLLVLGTALAGGCLGFLPMNAPRARVFLGDVGSYGIGYVVACLALLAAATPAPHAEAAAPGTLQAGDRLAASLILLPGSAVLIDSGLTLVRRVLRGERFWQGHREHLYQRAIAAGWTHMGIAGAYAGWTLAASGLMLALADAEAGLAAAATAAVYATGILIYLWAGRGWPRPDSTAKRVG